MKTSNETQKILGDWLSVCRGAGQKWTLALWCMISVSPCIATDMPAACVLDMNRMLSPSKNLPKAVAIEQLSPADGKLILEQIESNGGDLDTDDKTTEQAEPAQLSTWKAHAVRQNKVLTLRAESGQQRCYVNHAAEFPWSDPEGSRSIFSGRYVATPYLRVNSYWVHDAPEAELFHIRSGRALRLYAHSGLLAPDGKRLLAMDTSGFTVAVLADTAPAVELACVLPELPFGDKRALSFTAKGWSGTQRLAFTLHAKDKSQPPLAMRVQYSDGAWHLAASSPQTLAQIGGLRCSTQIEPPASVQACASGCEQVKLLTIAPALSYFDSLHKMFKWASDKGGDGHSAEMAEEIKNIAKNLDIGRNRPRDRKQARMRNEQGLAALRAKDWPLAIKHLRAAYDADVADVEIVNNLGYAELLAGDENASLHLVNALLLEPARANAWANLGHLFARHAAYQEAQACFALALRFSAKPAKTLQFLQDTAAKDSDPSLSSAVQLLLTQPWLAQLTAAEPGDKAQELLREATQGSAVAQFEVGYLYEKGEGFTRDYQQAATWYRKAADQGYQRAYANLGQLYEKGLGVPKDDAQAIIWYRKGAAPGDAVAQLNLGIFYAEGRGVVRDDQQAFIWYRRAAEQGLVEAQNNLGRMYDAGLGVTKDFKEAVRWYRKAAEQGHRTGLYNLGAMLVNGDGAPRDEVLAAMLFERAAMLGHTNAATERDRLMRRLSAKQVVEAKQLAAQWQPGNPLPTRSKTGNGV